MSTVVLICVGYTITSEDVCIVDNYYIGGASKHPLYTWACYNVGSNAYPDQLRRSGNFRVIKFSCFEFSRKNIFVVQDTHEKFLDSSTFSGLVIWNETTHAKSTLRTACMLRTFVATT